MAPVYSLLLYLSRFSHGATPRMHDTETQAKRARNLRRRSRTITEETQAGGTDGGAGASDRRDGERYNYFRSFNLTVQYGLLSTPLQGLTERARAICTHAHVLDPRPLEKRNPRGVVARSSQTHKRDRRKIGESKILARMNCTLLRISVPFFFDLHAIFAR